MNFDEAITAHGQWKIRLQGVLNGSSKDRLDPAVVGADDQCVLGQWIHREALAFAQLPEYGLLVEEHAHFHHCASEVLRLAVAGQMDQARASIDTDGPFYDASIRTILAIRHLRKKVEPARPV